jgi:threonine/homoserine/homoserine lactone efflux protein
MSFVSFVVAAIMVLITPGPTNTILAASGAAMGWRRALVLPVAEAAGYLVAVTAVWLLFSAWKLWNQPVNAIATERSAALLRVFMTTLLNPKAMLVGALLIPAMSPELRSGAVASFLCLSLIAGAIWTVCGSSLPKAVRPHAYRVAAVVIGLFSLMAASSAIAG